MVILHWKQVTLCDKYGIQHCYYKARQTVQYGLYTGLINIDIKQLISADSCTLLFM